MARTIQWSTLEIGILLLLLSACGALANGDSNATIAAEDFAFATEGAALVGTAMAQRTEIVVTVAAADTSVMLINSVNDQLYATLAAGSTPTIAVIQGEVSPAAGSVVATGASNSTFIITGISDLVDSATGCVANPRVSFPSSVTQLYITIQSYNSQAGTLMRAEWSFEGELRVQQDWVIDITAAERCLWFEVDTSDVVFTVGTWSVVVYQGEQNTAIGDPVIFSITENG